MFLSWFRSVRDVEQGLDLALYEICLHNHDHDH